MKGAAARGPNRCAQIIERIFRDFYEEGAEEVAFERADIERVAAVLKIPLPKNIGDVVYSFRYRTTLPASIQEKAPAGKVWVIKSKGRALYCFVAERESSLVPNPEYALNDEQALLAKLRYNRLVDTFTGVTCYSLQKHLRTTAPGIGQVETDEIYIGVDLCRCRRPGRRHSPVGSPRRQELRAGPANGCPAWAPPAPRIATSPAPRRRNCAEPTTPRRTWWTGSSPNSSRGRAT